MYTRFTWNPKPILTLYGGRPTFELNLCTGSYVLTPGVQVIQTSPGDYDITSDLIASGIAGGPTEGKDLTIELFEDEACTTSGDWGSVFCDKRGDENVEWIKCRNTDLNLAKDCDWLTKGTTIFVIDTGEIYELMADMSWQKMS